TFHCPAATCNFKNTDPASLRTHWRESHQNSLDLVCDPDRLRETKESDEPWPYPPPSLPPTSSTANHSSDSADLPARSTSPSEICEEEHEEDSDDDVDEDDLEEDVEDHDHHEQAQDDQEVSEDHDSPAPPAYPACLLPGNLAEAGTEANPIRTSILTHPLLQSYGLVIILPFRFVVCKRCSCGVPTHQLAGHCSSSKHRFAGQPPVDDAALEYVSITLDLTPSSCPIPPLFFTPVDNLPNPEKGWRCIHRSVNSSLADCQRAYGSKKAFLRHLDEYHPSTRRHTHRIRRNSEPCLRQSFFTFRTFIAGRPFLVQHVHIGSYDPTHVPGMREFLEDARKVASDRHQFTGNSVEMRALSHFNLRRQWHTLVQHFDLEALARLQDFSIDEAKGEAPFKGIQEACLGYIRSIHNVSLPSLDGDTVRRRVAISSGAFTIGVPHGPYAREQSTDQLGTLIRHLVFILVRLRGPHADQHPPFDLCLSSAQERAAQALICKIYDNASFHDELHAFLFALVTGKKQRGDIAWSALERFVLLACLQPSGAFKSVNIISPIVTRFLHLLRDVLCHHITLEAGVAFDQQLRLVGELAPYYTEGHDYPIDALSALSSIVTAIVNSKPSLPNTYWDHGRQNIVHRGMLVNVEHFRTGAVDI
ncbi:hypothetical protein CALVIDRAFT_561403, partial [Calocera viscosa TUFC12733]